MTVPKLRALFQRARAASIEYDGQPAYSMYTIEDIAPGTELRVRFEHASTERPQAIRLALSKASVGAFVLWANAARNLKPRPG